MTGRFRHGWNTFWMKREVPYGLALVRIVLPLVLLAGVLPRWPHARELYSSDGAPTPLWVSYGTSALLPPLPAPVAVGLFSLLVLCLFTASLGWRTRLSLAIVTVLYPAFGVIDQVSTLTKYTALSTHALLLLTISNCGAIWSVDAWIFGRTSGARLGSRPAFPVWPQRLLQLLVAVCYLGSAFTKMHTPAYFSGDQMLFWMLADMNFANPVGDRASLYPPLVLIASYVTILWEVLFIALVWRRPWRQLAIGVGILFHLMSTLLLGLIVFPLICLSLYLAFLDETTAERLVIAVRRAVQRMSNATTGMRRGTRVAPPEWASGRTSLAAFASLAAITAVVGVEVEYHLDVYRERGSGGPLALQPMDAEVAAMMLGPEQPIRPQDLFFSFDIGTTTLGGLLADRRRSFQHGEQALLQCHMTPPHPDMWVEVSLRDSQDRVMRRFGQIIPREAIRSNFTYQFDGALAPGTYAFVISYDDLDIARREFVLEGGTGPTSDVPGLAASR